MANLDDPGVVVPERIEFFNLLRNPAGPATPPGTPAMPALFFDDYFTDPTRKLVQTLTPSQYRIFREWANGNFDKTGAAAADGEPDALTRAMLEACVGAVRSARGSRRAAASDASIYAAGEVFRFDRTKLKPGGLTESMALPWRPTSRCAAGKTPCRPPSKQGPGVVAGTAPDDVLLNADDVTMRAGTAARTPGADGQPLAPAGRRPGDHGLGRPARVRGDAGTL